MTIGSWIVQFVGVPSALTEGSHVKTRLLLLLCSSASILLPACGASSPEAFLEKSIKISCQYLEKCEEAMWNDAKFESVNDCRDTLLEVEIPGQGTFRDLFVDNCTDFDKSAARTCLAAGRKAKRSCDDETEEPACMEVCGAPSSAGLGLSPEPLTDELVTRALEEMIERGELDLEVEDELTADQSGR
jgi:hypothetical protein